MKLTRLAAMPAALLLAVLALAAPAAGQTLVSSCVVAYPDHTTSRLCTALDTLTTSDAAKAPLASPTFTGDPKAPTPSAGDADTSIPTTAFTTGAIATAQALDLKIASDLSDLHSASTARTNLGLSIGTAVQAWDADLDCYAGLSATGFLKHSGAGACSSAALVSGDIPDLSATYQAKSTNLTNLLALSWSAGVQVPSLTAANVWALKAVGASTGNLLDKASGDSLYLGLTATAADSSKLGGTAAASYALTSAVTSAIAAQATTDSATYQAVSAKGAVSGYAGLDTSGLILHLEKGAHINVLTASSAIGATSAFDIQLLKRVATGGLSPTLPTAPPNGWTAEICDGKGDAAANPDTITATGSDTINGAASVSINTNYGCKRLTYSSTLVMWIAR